MGGDKGLRKAKTSKSLNSDSEFRCLLEKNGAPGGIRTPDPLLRRQMLYPSELRARRSILKDFAPSRPSICNLSYQME
jgi:hypothetical protein